MRVKGRLLSSTAIVKRFQVHPSDRLPFPLVLLPYVVLEKHSDGVTRPRKKFDDIFIHFDTIPACDGQTATLRQQ